MDEWKDKDKDFDTSQNVDEWKLDLPDEKLLEGIADALKQVKERGLTWNQVPKIIRGTKPELLFEIDFFGGMVSRATYINWLIASLTFMPPKI